VAGHRLRRLDGRKVAALGYDAELGVRDGAVDLRREPAHEPVLAQPEDDNAHRNDSDRSRDHERERGAVR
jgi:hypothetical protein